MATRLLFNVTTKEFLVADIKPPPSRDWRTLPQKMGIKWSADQSNNSLIWGAFPLWACNYVFNPAEDVALIEEYLDQIIDHYS